MLTTISRAFAATPYPFYRQLCRLALPISLQLIMASSLTLIDVLMVSSLGSPEVAAVGIANRFFFVVILMVAGLATGTSILASQYVGKGDESGVNRVLNLGLCAALVMTLPVSIAALMVPQQIMSLFSSDAAVIVIGADFIQITAPFHVLMGLVSVFAAVARATGQSMLPMVVGLAAVITNTLLNYCLIFGNWGAPQLGVNGAALATIAAKSLELGLMLSLLYLSRSRARLQLARIADSFESSELRRFGRQCLPLIINEFIWAFGIFSFTLVYSHMGTSEIAAITLLAPIESISIELFIGFTSAASILIATRLGADQFNDAKREALVLTTLITAGCILYGLLLAACGDLVLSIYRDVSSDVLAIASDIFLIIAATLWLRLFNVVTCVSILRSGGDVRFTLYVDMVVIWLIVLPMTAIAGLVLHWPIQWVFAIALGAEAVIKAPLYSRRIASWVWLKNLVKDDAAASASAPI